MEGLLVLGAVFSALGLLGGLSLRFGVDSRDGSADPRIPDGNLTV
jgi:hypothetical protein